MSDERFDVKFWGEIQPGKDTEAVKAAMAGLFRLSVEQTERLFSGQQLTVARDADGARANRLRTAIEQAGGVCALLPSGAAAAPAPPVQAAPPEPVAPKPEPPAPLVMETPALLEPEVTPTLESYAPSMPTATVWSALEVETLPAEEPAPATLPEADEAPAPEPVFAPAVQSYLPAEPSPRPRSRHRAGRRTGPDWLGILVAVLALLVALAAGYVAFFR